MEIDISDIYQKLKTIYNKSPFCIQLIEHLENIGFFEQAKEEFKYHVDTLLDEIGEVKKYGKTFISEPQFFAYDFFIKRISLLLKKESENEFISNLLDFKSISLYFVNSIRESFSNEKNSQTIASDFKKRYWKVSKNETCLFSENFKGFLDLDLVYRHYQRLEDHNVNLVTALNRLTNEQKNNQKNNSKINIKDFIDLRQWHTLIKTWEQFKIEPRNEFEEYCFRNYEQDLKLGGVLYKDNTRCIYKLPSTPIILYRFYESLVKQYPFTKERFRIWKDSHSFVVSRDYWIDVFNYFPTANNGKYKDLFKYLLDSPLGRTKHTSK